MLQVRGPGLGYCQPDASRDTVLLQYYYSIITVLLPLSLQYYHYHYHYNGKPW